jgi:hypothetical protein
MALFNCFSDKPEIEAYFGVEIAQLVKGRLVRFKDTDRMYTSKPQYQKALQGSIPVPASIHLRLENYGMSRREKTMKKR